MVYRTWGEHANHYPIYAVPLVMMYFVDSSSITTENLILIVVGSVGALAVVIDISTYGLLTLDYIILPVVNTSALPLFFKYMYIYIYAWNFQFLSNVID